MEKLYNGGRMGSLLGALQQRNELLGELVEVLQQVCDPQMSGDIAALEALIERQAALEASLAALAELGPSQPGGEGSEDPDYAAAWEQSLLLVTRLAAAAAGAGAVIAGRLTYLRAEAAYIDRLMAPAQTYRAGGLTQRAGAAAAAPVAAKA